MQQCRGSAGGPALSRSCRAGGNGRPRLRGRHSPRRLRNGVRGRERAPRRAYSRWRALGQGTRSPRLPCRRRSRSAGAVSGGRAGGRPRPAGPGAGGAQPAGAVPHGQGGAGGRGRGNGGRGSAMEAPDWAGRAGGGARQQRPLRARAGGFGRTCGAGPRARAGWLAGMCRAGAALLYFPQPVRSTQ